ncbi:MAG: methionine--tRNA ligase [Fimbriimonadaceae bacterium]|nr:methionine--tRNA ligase [Fimbriimonadaceae bacterium]QYK56280.1 MAG: methionine--tRNA ligase [Fimbriimonadaceae bacterium]
MPKRYYVTTPIYYVNSTPHVGHALTMLVCDVEKRYRRMQGDEVVFLTGTDENGLKVKEAAEAAGEDPMVFVDRISQTFRDAASLLDIDYDVFMRTTSPEHKRAAQRLFEILRENGHIYTDTYEGWYDVSAETFVKESDLVDGKSPDGNEVRWVSEENDFFRLSAFGDRLLEKIEGDPQFLLPEGRRNEVVSFIKQGLRDLCVTRANPGWGIPVPGDESKVIYVWFDALINYLAATGWPDATDWDQTWPADVHWMAKEIFTRFHATLWPAMLMGAGLPLPKSVVAHGWFTFNDAKMSKSKGNVLRSEELVAFFEEAGCERRLAVDALRFCLARLLPFESDTNFTMFEIERTYNTDLANDLGNALNRSLSMAHKFVAGKVPDADVEPEALEAVASAKAAVEKGMDAHRLDEALDSAMKVVQFLNKQIDTWAPWALAKAGDPRLGPVVKSMVYCLYASEGLLRPFVPGASDAVAAQLGLAPTLSWAQVGNEGRIPAGHDLGTPKPMFPRLEKKPGPPVSPPNPPLSSAGHEPSPQNRGGGSGEKPTKKAKFEPPAEIEITDVMKVKLQIGRVIEAEPVPGSEKLLKLGVMIGEERRQILAGIAKRYKPVDMVGRQVVVVANLKPAKLMGMESQGMLLAADDVDGTAILLEPEREAPEGAHVH